MNHLELKKCRSPTVNFGFELETFANLAKEAGFEEVNIEIVSVAKKPYGEYPIFLLTGVKR